MADTGVIPLILHLAGGGRSYTFGTYAPSELRVLVKMLFRDGAGTWSAIELEGVNGPVTLKSGGFSYTDEYGFHYAALAQVEEFV